MIESAHRISYLRAEGASSVLARVQALEARGREIIHLERGQPDFKTYPHIVLAGVSASAIGQTPYNPPSGSPALRQALAEVACQQLDSMPFRASITHCRGVAFYAFLRVRAMDDHWPNWLTTWRRER